MATLTDGCLTLLQSWCPLQPIGIHQLFNSAALHIDPVAARLTGAVNHRLFGVNGANLVEEVTIAHYTGRVDLAWPQMGRPVDTAMRVARSRRAAQIGSTLCSSRRAATKSTSIAVGGRSPPQRNAEACFEIVFVRRNSRLSRSRAAIRSASLVEGPRPAHRHRFRPDDPKFVQPPVDPELITDPIDRTTR